MTKSDTKLPVIVVGMSLHELSYFHKSSLVAKKAGEFWYLKDKNVVRCEHEEEFKSALEQMCDKKQNEVEIMGSYTDLCVADAINYALELGIIVYVPDDKVLCSKWETGKSTKDVLIRYVGKVDYDYKRAGNMHKFMPKTKK